MVDLTRKTSTVTAFVIDVTNPEGVAKVGILMRPGAMLEQASVKTALASAKLRLFKAGEVDDLDALTPLSVLVAAECDFSGYPAGGLTVGAFGDPISQGNGAQITGPMSQFNFLTPEEDPPVTNTVGGWFLVDSTGVVRYADNLTNPVPMIDDTCGLPISLSDLLNGAVS